MKYNTNKFTYILFCKRLSGENVPVTTVRETNVQPSELKRRENHISLHEFRLVFVQRYGCGSSINISVIDV